MLRRLIDAVLDEIVSPRFWRVVVQIEERADLHQEFQNPASPGSIGHTYKINAFRNSLTNEAWQLYPVCPY
jgi:hypothetical protein